MERIPKGQYTKDFREEAVKLVGVEKLRLREASRQLSIPVGTLKNWVVTFRNGNLQDVRVGSVC